MTREVVPHPSLSDEDWRPTAYTFYDENLDILWTSSAPMSDEEALTYIERILPHFGKVAFIQGRRHDGTAVKIK